MKQKNNVNIDNFLVALDNLISSKYILAERKISDVLFSIAHETEVYNLIAKCMVNFDFKAQWKAAISSHFFKLPELDEDRIAFIFCLLSNIDDKNIEFTNFLSTYFAAANSYSAYELFSKTIIIEFKRLIIKLLNVDNLDCQQNDTVEDEVQKFDNFGYLQNLVVELVSKIKMTSKLKRSFLDKNDLIAVLSTLELIAKDKQTEYLYAFRVTLNSALAKNKLFKSDIEQINQVIDKIIRGIYE